MRWESARWYSAMMGRPAPCCLRGADLADGDADRARAHEVVRVERLLGAEAVAHEEPDRGVDVGEIRTAEAAGRGARSSRSTTGRSPSATRASCRTCARSSVPSIRSRVTSTTGSGQSSSGIAVGRGESPESVLDPTASTAPPPLAPPLRLVGARVSWGSRSRCVDRAVVGTEIRRDDERVVAHDVGMPSQIMRPASRQSTRSLIPITSGMSCSMTSRLASSACAEPQSGPNASLFAARYPAVGSSRHSTVAPDAIRHASSTMRRVPVGQPVDEAVDEIARGRGTRSPRRPRRPSCPGHSERVGDRHGASIPPGTRLETRSHRRAP